MRKSWSDPQVREVLLWALPALLLGLILRIMLSVSMPYGYMQYDTGDFLVTAQRFFSGWDLVIHNKKTFLGPILFALAFLVKIVPVLILVPLIQHLGGLVMTLATAVLVRLWFKNWKWFIIPVTVLTTANPAILWYEHALLAEAHYIFCVMLLAAIATAFALFRTKGLFIAMLVTLVFTAGSRPEGKLYFSVAFLLVGFVYWGNWKEWGKKLAILSVVALGTFAITKTGQAGELLYATVLPLAPDVPKSAPEFGPMVNPLRDKYREQGVAVRTELTNAEKDISQLAHTYLNARKIKMDSAVFCQKLAVEACLNKPHYLPIIAWNKFLMTMNYASSAGFNEYWLYEKQLKAFLRKPWMFELTKGLTGKELKSKEDIQKFLAAHYSVPKWFGRLQEAWDKVTIKTRMHSHRYPTVKIPGLPYYFLVAFIGMIAAMLMPGPLRGFHIAWVVSLMGVWFVVLLTGVVNSRYRFVFEPFCTIYALLLVDLLWSAASSFFSKPHAIPKPAPAAVTANEQQKS